MDIFENERVDEVNERLRLIQKTDGLTFGTDALLLAAYVKKGYQNALELGSGTGIISMLLLARDKVKKITALEIQEEYARLTERNAELNGLTSSLTALEADVRDFNGEGKFDLVFTNPPYMKSDAGKNNDKMKKSVARHEICGNIYDFTAAARRALKFGGDLYAVYRAERISDLFCAMRENKIEPKLLTPVIANQKSEPSMILVRGTLGAAVGLKFTRPFIIYKDENNKEYSEDMELVLQNGIFADSFTTKNVR